MLSLSICSRNFKGLNKRQEITWWKKEYWPSGFAEAGWEKAGERKEVLISFYRQINFISSFNIKTQSLHIHLMFRKLTICCLIKLYLSLHAFTQLQSHLCQFFCLGFRWLFFSWFGFFGGFLFGWLVSFGGFLLRFVLFCFVFFRLVLFMVFFFWMWAYVFGVFFLVHQSFGWQKEKAVVFFSAYNLKPSPDICIKWIPYLHICHIRSIFFSSALQCIPATPKPTHLFRASFCSGLTHVH